MSTSNLTINELLCFIAVQSDKLTTDFLQKTLQEFYTVDEVTKAKSILLTEFDKVLDPEIIKEQRKNRLNGKTSAKEKIVKDILDIWIILDQQNAGVLKTQFVAADINRIPLVNAEKFNLQFLVSSILKLQDQFMRQENLNDNVLSFLYS